MIKRTGHIWLIRHGETEWSLSGQHTGRTEKALTALGEQRAAAVGTALKGAQFELVLTSPRQRARETCRLAGYAGQAQIDPDLQEWDYGAYEGRTTKEIQKELPGWSIWCGPVPQGETIAQVAARADRLIARVVNLAGPVAFFAHGHILRILTARWLELAPEGGRLFALDTGSISVLGYEHETHVISRWNQVPSIEAQS